MRFTELQQSVPLDLFFCVCCKMPPIFAICSVVISCQKTPRKCVPCTALHCCAEIVPPSSLSLTSLQNSQPVALPPITHLSHTQTLWNHDDSDDECDDVELAMVGTKKKSYEKSYPLTKMKIGGCTFINLFGACSYIDLFCVTDVI